MKDSMNISSNIHKRYLQVPFKKIELHVRLTTQLVSVSKKTRTNEAYFVDMYSLLTYFTMPNSLDKEISRKSPQSIQIILKQIHIQFFNEFRNEYLNKTFKITYIKMAHQRNRAIVNDLSVSNTDYLGVSLSR